MEKKGKYQKAYWRHDSSAICLTVCSLFFFIRFKNHTHMVLNNIRVNTVLFPFQGNTFGPHGLFKKYGKHLNSNINNKITIIIMQYLFNNPLLAKRLK